MLTLPQLVSWLVSPFKAPEKHQSDNKMFNHAVSHVRIRSEHAFGFLKGRFQSLKGLRVMITDEKTHKYATYWVAVCIAVHNFAMESEAAERQDSSDVNEENEAFIAAGLSSTLSSSDEDKTR
jgi:hypothetical protein